MSDELRRGAVREITTDDLRKMEDKEGLVLQGCGGSIQEWVDGINGLLTDAGILQDGSKFENVSVFQHDTLRRRHNRTASHGQTGAAAGQNSGVHCSGCPYGYAADSTG